VERTIYHHTASAWVPAEYWDELPDRVAEAIDVALKGAVQMHPGWAVTGLSHDIATMKVDQFLITVVVTLEREGA
jgi:hypothetical protein